MPRDENKISKAELFKKLRFSGIPEQTIAELDAALPEPVDLERDGEILMRYGLTRDGLISQRGGSP